MTWPEAVALVGSLAVIAAFGLGVIWVAWKQDTP